MARREGAPGGPGTVTDAARDVRAAVEAAERAVPPGLADGAGAFARLFVRRPVLAIVANLLIVVAGLAALFAAEVRELPDIDNPVVTVTTLYEGASPATMDTEVTEPVERAVSRVAGLKSLSSSSRFGRSTVTAEFRDGTDLDIAANDIREAIARIRRDLPEEAEEPAIVKADSNAEEVMRLSLVAEGVPVADLTRLARDLVRDRLSAVEGIADVELRGDREPVLLIEADQSALAGRGLDLGDLAAAVSAAAGEVPAGTLSSPTQELVVRARLGLTSPEDFAALQLDRTTRLGDVATVRFGPDRRTILARTDGQQSIGIGLFRRAGSNALAISAAVRAEVARLAPLLPAGVELRVISDEATFVGGAIREVVTALGEATLIVVAVLLVFLGSLRATLIPALTLPVTLIGTLAAIWLAGFSVNILTLLALVLATGLVVDDAIVVIENVMRRRAQGMPARAAALVGTREVFFAVIATSATLAAVFVPISLLPGQVGGLFREFGWVLALSVALSSLVTLTLCPMLAARILGAPPPRPPLAARLLDLVGTALAAAYAAILRRALDAPLVTATLALLFVGGAALLHAELPREVTPREDRGTVLVSVQGPPGVSLDWTDAQLRRIEAAAAPFVAAGEAQALLVFAGFGGPGSGFLVMPLAPWAERDRTQAEISAAFARDLAAIPGVRIVPITPNSLRIRGGGRGLQIAVAGPEFGSIAAAARRLVERMREDPRFGDVRLSFEPTQPQVTVAIDRVRAADLGIDVPGLSRALQAVLDGRRIGTLQTGTESVPIRLGLAGLALDDPGDLENVFLTTPEGRILPLSSIATLTESAAPAVLQREERLRSVPVTASLAPGVPIAAAFAEAERLAGDVLPEGMRIVPLAEARTLGETSGGFAITFALALAVVLLVLAAQFESFLAALIILLTVPLGLAAAVVAMVATGGSLNVYSQIGLVLLVGVMAKNGILIVEFANQLRERGLGLRPAIEAAARIRLRPVVMTAVSTVLGGLPLVLADGAGAEARIALGWIVVGGLGAATLATLFVTPVAYLALARFTRPRAEEEARLAREIASLPG